ncbi:hypothetical protein INR49_030929 [Caranx melampygus]|nr:hypothetical protein INR49_030929 [Caranx melampygus]
MDHTQTLVLRCDHPLLHILLLLHLLQPQTTVVPKHPSYEAAHFYQQNPFYFLPPIPPLPSKEISQTILQEAQKPVVPQATCPPYTHTICSYYSHPYYPYYHPFYSSPYHLPHLPVPQHQASHPPLMATDTPFTTTTTTPTPTTESTTTSPPTQLDPQMPHLKCLPGRMVIFLPFAHPDSIQTPTTISLPIRFWDLSTAQYRTLELQCPFYSTHETPAPVTPPVPPTPPSTTLSPVLKPRVICSSHQMTVELPPGSISGILLKECNLPSKQRLPCGPTSVSQPQCLSMGCCFSKHPPACYYPMDECTIDRHFVFSVPASLTEPPLSPALLVAASNSTCKPQRVTSDYALFKIPMDGCGARRVRVGKMMIYMVEIVNKVQAISLNYGTITRDSPIRLLVECRFQPGTVLTVSYLVKTPTLGPEVHTQGMFGVQLRIAKDAQYSSYHPQYHQPLQMLLGKPLYLEVRLLNAPDPTPQQAVVSDPRPHSQGQTRRFTISTFQFLPDDLLHVLN